MLSYLLNQQRLPTRGDRSSRGAVVSLQVTQLSRVLLLRES
eukprot:COSAG06_NODE_40961_length_396_cov_1.454545_2_plen_40_part_01